MGILQNEVNRQGEHLQQASSNVEQADVLVDDGGQQIAIASKYKTASRKKILCIIISVIVVVTVIIIIALFAAKVIKV